MSCRSASYSVCSFLCLLSVCLLREGHKATASTHNQPDYSLVVKSLSFERGTVGTELSGNDGAFIFRTNDIQLKLAPDVFECLSNFNFEGNIAADRILSCDVNQWVLWKIDMFNSYDERTWMPSPISRCGHSADYFLGGPCMLSEGRVNRYYRDIPPHRDIKITGRVHFFDQWNGETLSLKVDNNTVWSESYNWCPTVLDAGCTKYGIDSCGQEYPDRLSVNFNVSMPHTADRIALEFNSTLKINACEASWGIDDVAIYIR